jgi:hypothetical protein
MDPGSVYTNYTRETTKLNPPKSPPKKPAKKARQKSPPKKLSKKARQKERLRDKWTQKHAKSVS